ncbi:MAG: acyl carrier protein, partial [Lawsonibacter sp.]|nr:acyl carrier protein [Lawsonibacter sp.]
MEITFENVRDIIVETLSCDVEDVKLDTNLVEDLEADSLEIVELSMALQEKLGAGIEDEDLEKIHTV